jgi:hypothetical protein
MAVGGIFSLSACKLDCFYSFSLPSSTETGSVGRFQVGSLICFVVGQRMGIEGVARLVSYPRVA